MVAVAAVAIPCLTSVRTASAQEQVGGAWLTLQGGPEYGFRADSSPAIVRIAMVLSPSVNARRVTLTLDDARFEQRYDAAIARAFDSLWVAARSRTESPAMFLRVHPDQLARPGTYHLVIAARTPGQPDLRLPIRIVHAAARLRAVPTLVVRRVEKWPLGGASLRLPSLVLAESTAVTRLTNVRARQVMPFAHDSGAVAGTVAVVVPDVIAPGATESGQLTVHGDFPLGTSRGSIEVSARELAQPLSIAVEVRTRRSHLFILVAILAGVIVSYLGRVWLVHRAEAAKAKGGLFNLEQQIAAEVRQGDDTFREALTKIRSRLATAYSERDAAAIQGHAKGIADDFAKAQGELDERLSEAGSQLGVALALVELPWIQRTAAAEHAEWKRRLALVRLRLSQGNLGAASAALGEVRAGIQQVIAPGATTAARHARAVSTELMGRLDVPSSLAAQLDTTVEKVIEPMLPGIKSLPSTASFADMMATAQAIEQVTSELQSTIGQLRLWLQRAVEAFAVALAQVPIPEPDQVRALEQAAAAVDRELVAREQDPLGADRLVPPVESEKLASAWRTATESQLAGVSDGDAEGVRAALNEGRYVEAARMVAALWRTKPAERRTVDGAKARETALGSLDEEDDAAGRPGSPAAWLALLGAGRRSVVPAGHGEGGIMLAISPGRRVSFEERRARNYRELLGAQFGQGVVVALVVGITGYLLFVNGYVGSSVELAKAFLWALGLDTTVNGAWDLAKKR